MAKFYNFQLLADGAADGDAGAAPMNSPEVNTGGEQNPGSANNDGSDAENKEGAKKNVQVDPAARAREFENLIKGDFKAEFDSKVQSIIDRRFKAQRGIAKEYEAVKPIIDVLMQRYNTSDIAGLKSAIDSDDSYWEIGAEKEGLGVKQYKEMMQLRAEVQKFKKEQEMTQQQRYLIDRIEGWQREGESLKVQYPDFDLEAELENKDFKGLLNAGIPMKQAYELVHMAEIREAIEKQAEKSVMDHIRANGTRVPENGVKGSNGFVLGKDVSAMTKEDRQEIARRVQRGERIVL